MDNTLIIKKIILILLNENKIMTLGELSNRSEISLEVIKKCFVDLEMSGISTYIKLNFYKDEEEVDSFSDIVHDELENIEVEIDVRFGMEYGDLIQNLTLLTSKEEFQLYMLLKENESGFGKASRDKLIKALSNDYNNKYNKLNSKVILKNVKIPTEINQDILKMCYKYIEKSEVVTIVCKHTTFVNCVLTSVIYNEDSLSWSVQYIRKKKTYYIRLDKIQDINKKGTSIIRPKSLNIQDIAKDSRGNFGIGKATKVKFRIYHEKNAKEKALRYILNKKVNIDTNAEFTDFNLVVEDTNLFLRWIRKMGPSAIILEPRNLRNEMLKEIESWSKNY